ncbi:cytochrome P450 2G1-like [Discoglossus pictus]
MYLTCVEILLLLVTFLCIYSTWNQMYRKRNLPPGPTPLPVIGNLLQLKRGEMAGSLMKLWAQYGPVYTLYLGTRPVIFLCGYHAVKEALIDQGEEFGARGRLPTLENVAKDYGISLSNGERWRQIRSFAVRTLRNFGLGKKSTEGKIQEEAKKMVEELRKYKELPLDPSKIILDAVSNIVCTVVFGDRFEYKDERFQKILSLTEETFRIMSSTWGQLESIIPELMKYVPGPHKKIYSITEQLVSFIKERVKINQETLDPSFPRDFIDCYLIKMQQEKANPNTEFTMRNLLMAAHNLFLGGTDTVSSTLKHALLILMTFTETQDQIHREIDQVIGRERSPNLDDRSKMPYTYAVIHEVQRFADMVPLNAPRSVTKDTQFRGYTIPKGTDIYPLLCTVHRDPSQFSTPYKFNPNHFLDENGIFKKNDASMPFSTGKRMCPGESVARMEIFLFLTTILQNFNLASEKKFTEADIAPKMTGFVNHPIPFKLSFIAR